MKIKFAVWAVAFVFTLMACSNKSKTADLAELKKTVLESPIADKEFIQNGNETEFTADTTKQSFSPGKPDDRKKENQSLQTPNPDWDKKIIKTATLNFEVKDYNTYNSSFREKVRGLGGYVAQEEQTQSDYKIENTLVIKVPVDQFDNAVTQLSAGIKKIYERKITSQDVTGEFVDTKSRMEAKKQVRQRYMDLLKQAKNMEEILSVQSEINGIQEEIESAAGRIEYLGHSSSFSTINLTYYQVLNSSAKDNSKPSFGAKIMDAFKTGSGWLVDLLIGLVAIWPLFLLTFVLIIVYKKIKASKPKQA